MTLVIKEVSRLEVGRHRGIVDMRKALMDLERIDLSGLPQSSRDKLQKVKYTLQAGLLGWDSRNPDVLSRIAEMDKQELAAAVNG